MSFTRGDGSAIEIYFTEPLNLLSIIGNAYRTLRDAQITTLNAYSSSYNAAYLNDGLITNYWYGSTGTNWINITFLERKIAHGFRWYIPNTSYCPKTFNILGSNDGITWTQLNTDIYTDFNVVGWQEFPFTNTQAWSSYKIDILTSAYSPMVSEIELLLDYGAEKSFTVIVPEYNYVPNGSIQNISKKVKSIINKAEDSHAIILHMEDNQRFPSAAGDITVIYDGSGGLAGEGGSVAAFEEVFTPIELIAKPHQNAQENIGIAHINASGTLIAVFYSSYKNADECILLSNITALGILRHVNDV